jgi:hypothetical protein
VGAIGPHFGFEDALHQGLHASLLRS